jgi:hypothetical protein
VKVSRNDRSGAPRAEAVAALPQTCNATPSCYVERNQDLFNNEAVDMRKSARETAVPAGKHGSRQARTPAKKIGVAKSRGRDPERGDNKARVEAVMKAAERSGLLRKKNGRIAGRVSARLVEQAKKLTGIEGDTDLIEFALASVALEDDFAEVFKQARGKVPADLKLGF